MNKLIATILVSVVLNLATYSQTTEFNYQGNLKDGTTAANGNYDFEFALFDSLTTGTQQGGTLTRSAVAVSSGSFSVKLDFGSQFSGAGRFLEIHVRPAGSGSFTVLAPRQQISNTPYSMRSLNSATADTATNATNSTNAAIATNALQLGGVAANQYVITTDPRMTDARSPVSGSDNYIQNRTTPQGGNFSISGDGTAGGTVTGNIVNATTQYNLGGSRILTADVNNTFLGLGIGPSNTGPANSFFGSSAGSANTSGFNNAFFGTRAGQANTTGGNNSFFGSGAGTANTVGQSNAFFGPSAGGSNTVGENNAFFGSAAGGSNTAGVSNSFFGTAAGLGNTTGNNNSFFGLGAGRINTTGGNNTFFGLAAGGLNTTGIANTIIGDNANVTVNNLANATAIGSRATVGASNSLVLGSINGLNGASADTNVGIGTNAPATRLHVSGTGIIRARINSDSNAGMALTLNNQPGWSIATVTGGQFQIFNDSIGANAVWIDSTNNNVGLGVSLPGQKLDVLGDVRVGTGTTGCITDRDGTIVAGTCSSDLRFKKNVVPFANVLNRFASLRPVYFEWRSDEFKERSFGPGRGFGLIAQEAEKGFPELIATEPSGYKAVNYSMLPLITVQAVREQQAEIEALKQQIAVLKAMLCGQMAEAAICKQ